ncbi:hypothetical protein BYT27DRAFT_7180497 [Phlegmacium glaucopus]|nr:hypothetical protein BYT27DRAFT_7180497 [Phlegmacium glaucopus]
MPVASGSHHTRRSSTISVGSSDSDDDSPDLSALDSSAALILLPDSEESNIPFDFTDDEDNDRDEFSNFVSPVFDMRISTVFPPLRPSLVFLYLLAPYLKLGALNLPNSRLPLKYSLLALFTSALASVFSRQIWYMLARYLRNANLTEVVLDTFARGRGKEQRRMVLRGSVRAGTGILLILVAVTYLRYALYLLQPLLPQKFHPVVTYSIMIFFIAPVLGYLSYAKSLQSKRIIYATSLSIVTYVLWISVIIYRGSPKRNTSWLGSGSFWPAIATIAFAFCTSSTLPLYASLKTTAHPISTAKTPRSRSFRFLSFLSVVAAVLLLLPSLLFASSPQSSTDIPPNGLVIHSQKSAVTVMLDSTPSIPPLLPDVGFSPELQAIFASFTLILGIPSVIVTTPLPPLPGLRSVKFNVPRVSTIFLVLLLAVIPPRFFANHDIENHNDHSYLASSGIFAVLTITLTVMALLSTYFLPAFVHISTHFFKRPLTIVIPRKPAQQSSSNLNSAVNDDARGIDSVSRQSSPKAIHDELLLRKERALQKKQFRKRIVWDIGVWTLLFASVALIVFTICGFAGVWQP